MVLKTYIIEMIELKLLSNMLSGRGNTYGVAMANECLKGAHCSQ